MSSAIVGALRVVLGMDSAAFEKGADAAAKKLGGLGKRFAKIGGAMQSFGAALSLGVTTPLIGLGAASIKAASEAAQASAAVEQALKTMGNGAGFAADDLKKMASEIEKVTTFDGDDILGKVTANLLTFGKVQGDVFKRAQMSAVDLSARLGTDLQSATIMVGKALQDPVKGIAALTRVGVSFTAQQKEQVKAMVAAGNTAGAQAMILAELERQYGGQAKALAATDPGKMTQAWVQLGNASEAIGNVLLPVLADLSVYVKNAAEWFSELSPQTQKFTVIAGGIVAIIGPAVMVLGTMATGIGVLLPLLPALGAAFTAVLGPIGLVALAVAGLTYAWYNWDEISKQFPAEAVAVETGMSVLKQAATALGTHVSLTFTALKQVLTGDFTGAWQTAKNIVSNEIASIGAIFETIFPGVIASVKMKALEIVAAFVAMKDQAIAAVAALVTGVETYIVGKLNTIFDGVKAKIQTVSDAFYNMYDAVVGHSYVPDMVDGVALHMARLNGGMVAPALSTTAQTATAFQAMGQSIEQSLSGWIDSAIDGTFKFKTAILDLAKSAAKAGLKNILSGIFNGAGGGQASGFAGILGAMFGGFRAKGGPMAGNKWHVVGERGPELIPPQGSRRTVIPNHAMGGGAGGGVTYNIDARGADQAAIARLEMKISDITRNEQKRVIGAVRYQQKVEAGFA
jgi:hypothetical protein